MHRTTRILLIIVLLALALRVGAIFALKAWNNPNYMEHGPIAHALLEKGTFAFSDWGVFQPSSVQSPPYPLLLAGLYRTLGYAYNPDTATITADSAHTAAMLINAVFGAISVALTFFLVRTLGGGKNVGLFAAALVAVWPTQIYLVTTVQAIAFIVMSVLAMIILFYKAVDSQNLWPWTLYGIIGCTAALTEPVLLPFMALSGLFILFWRDLPFPIRLRNAIVLFVTALVVLGPWAYRNYLVHGALMPVKSTFWVNVWKSNNPNASGTDRPQMSEEMRKRLMAGMTDDQRRDPRFDNMRQYDLMPAEQRAELMNKPEVEREKVFAKFAKTWVSENPRRALQLCGIRLLKTLWIEWDNPKALNAPYVTARSLLLLLTPLALYAAWRARWRMFIPFMLVGSGLLMYTLTIAAARFALPYEPWQLAMISLLLIGFFWNTREESIGSGR